MQCMTCKKEYTKQTLDKHRGLYCKGCYLDVIIQENKKLHNDHFTLNTKYSFINKEYSSLQTLYHSLKNSYDHRLKDCVTYENELAEQKRLNIENYKTIYYGNNKKKIKYVGQTKDNDFHGFGSLYSQTGHLLYIGQWKQGIVCGEGKDYINGILHYEGIFVNGKYQGSGTLYRENGNILYEGGFIGGQRRGSCKIYDKNGSLEFEGDIEEGVGEHMITGLGKYYSRGILRYEGSFEKGKYHGIGKSYWDNSNIRYEGSFVKGTIHGTGKSYHEDGTLEYEGDFEKGIYNVNEDELCIICYKNKKTYAFIPCGHLCICNECVDKYEDDKCIICRKEFCIPHKIYNLY